MRKFSLALILVMACTALGACSVGTDTASGPAGNAGSTERTGTSGNTDAEGGTGAGTAAPAAGHAIVFEVTGDGVSKATSITYGIDGKNQESDGTTLPWQKRTSATSVQTLSLAARSQGDGSGSISCRITVDGNVVANGTAQGQDATVNCNAS
jgi:hypothetical protein